MDIDVGEILSWGIWLPALEHRISRRGLHPLKRSALQNSVEIMADTIPLALGSEEFIQKEREDDTYGIRRQRTVSGRI